MQTMQLASLRPLPPLGAQSSGLFGDVKNPKFHLPSKEVVKTCVKASYSWPGSSPSQFPSRSNQPPPGFQQQSTPTPLPSEEATVPSPAESTLDAATSSLPRAAPEAPSAPEDRNFTSAKPPSAASGLKGFNFPATPVSGTPRPKPGTPRPYDPTKQKSKVMEWLTPPPPPTELLQREHYRLSPTCTCTIYFGDLSKWSVDGKCDAVIAPANKRLNTGPAVNAVLFKAAGTRLLDATQRLPDVAPQGIKAEVGDAISTRAFNLPVFRVIHTVGPVYKKDENGNRISDDDLVRAYKSALDVARKENLTCLAFPPLSCRIYGYPYSEGAEIALRTLKENCEGFTQIDIVIRNIEGYDAFIDEANKVLERIREKKTIKLRIGGDSTVAQATSSITPPALGASVVAPLPGTAAQSSTSSMPGAGPFTTSPPSVPPEASTGLPSAPTPPTPPAPPTAPTAPAPERQFYADPQPRNYNQSYPNQAFSGSSYQQQQPAPGPFSDPPPRNYRPTYPNPNAGPYSHPPPRTQHPTYPNPRFQQDAGPNVAYQGYREPPPPKYQPPPPPQHQQTGPPYQQRPVSPPPPPQYQQQPPSGSPQYQQQTPSVSPQYQQQPPSVPPQYQQQPPSVPPQYQQQPPSVPPQYQQQPGSVPPQYQQQPGSVPPQYQQQPGLVPPQYQQQPPPVSPPPATRDSSFIPPRERPSPIPPSGPPPTPPSSPTMPYPERYQY